MASIPKHLTCYHPQAPTTVYEDKHVRRITYLLENSLPVWPVLGDHVEAMFWRADWCSMVARCSGYLQRRSTVIGQSDMHVLSTHLVCKHTFACNTQCLICNSCIRSRIGIPYFVPCANEVQSGTGVEVHGIRTVITKDTSLWLRMTCRHLNIVTTYVYLVCTAVVSAFSKKSLILAGRLNGSAKNMKLEKCLVFV